MANVIREPIQVYLTPTERAELDRAAREMGISRSEVLRRGIQAMAGTRGEALRRDLADEGYMTRPRVGPGTPPPSAPVAPLATLLAELADDRSDP